MSLHGKFTLLENFNLIFFKNNLNKFKFEWKKKLSRICTYFIYIYIYRKIRN